MELTVDSRALRRALDQARRAVSPAPGLVAYTGVLFQAAERFGLITGSDGETTVTAKVAIECAEPGQALIVPGPLAGYLEKMPEGPARVTVDADGDLTVGIGEREPYRFRQLGATFPAPQLDRSGLVDADLGELRGALAAVRHASEGVIQLRSDEHQVMLAATDNYRIAQVSIPGAGFGAFAGVVALAALEHLAREPVEQIGLDARGRQLRARGPEVFLTTRLIDEAFPEVGPIVEERGLHAVTVDGAALLESLDRLAVVSGRRTIALQLGGGTLALRAADVQLGAGSEAVPATGSLEELACHVSAGFLRDAVAAHPAGELELAWSGALRPIHLRSSRSLAIRTVVMPVQI